MSDGSPKRLVVLLKLLKLRGQLLDLLHLVVDHLDVLGDVLGLVKDLLHIHGRVVNNLLGANWQGRQQPRDDNGE